MIKRIETLRADLKQRVKGSFPGRARTLPPDTLCTLRLQAADISDALEKQMRVIMDLTRNSVRPDFPVGSDAFSGAMLPLAEAISELWQADVLDTHPLARHYAAPSDHLTNTLKVEFAGVLKNAPAGQRRSFFDLLESVVGRLRLATGLGMENVWHPDELCVVINRGQLQDWTSTHLLLAEEDAVSFVEFFRDHILMQPEAFFADLNRQFESKSNSDHASREAGRRLFGQIPLQWLTLFSKTIRDNSAPDIFASIDLYQFLPRFFQAFYDFSKDGLRLFNVGEFFEKNPGVGPIPDAKHFNPTQKRILSVLATNIDEKDCKGFAVAASDHTLFRILQPLFTIFLKQQFEPIDRQEAKILTPALWGRVAWRLRLLAEPLRKDFLAGLNLRPTDKNHHAARVFLGLDRREVEARKRGARDVDLELTD